MSNVPNQSDVPTQPRIEFDELGDLTSINDWSDSRQPDHELESFDNLDLTEMDLSNHTFVECAFHTANFTGASLRAVRIRESRLHSPFAISLSAPRSQWRSTYIDSPRWGSAEIFDSTLSGVHIRGGKIDYLNLRAAKLTDVLFENVVINDLDLGGATCTRVALRNCQIDTLDLSSATNTDLDLRTSDYPMINGIEGMRGAIIDSDQLTLMADAFAHQLGIQVISS